MATNLVAVCRRSVGRWCSKLPNIQLSDPRANPLSLLPLLLTSTRGRTSVDVISLVRRIVGARIHNPQIAQALSHAAFSSPDTADAHARRLLHERARLLELSDAHDDLVFMQLTTI